MKVAYTSLKSAIANYIEDNALDEVNIDESLLNKWATDCVRWLIATPESLKHKIAILPVDNYKARLPEDFKMLQQAGSNPDMGKDTCCGCSKRKGQCTCPNGFMPFARTRHERVSQWIQRSFDPECSLEINLVCDNCRQRDCTCNQPVVEVDVDSIWLAANPQAFYKGYKYHGTFGRGGAGMPPTAGTGYYGRPRFRLMRAAASHMFNAENYLTDCPSIKCKDCFHEFELDLPFIEVDFYQGEVLLSYLAMKKDANGDLMVPDDPDAFEAINQHLDHKWYAREAAQALRSKKEKKFAVQYKSYSKDAKFEREEAIGLFKSKVDIPDFKSFKRWLDNVWLKRMPFDHHDNLNARTEDEFNAHSRRLDGAYNNFTGRYYNNLIGSNFFNLTY